MKVKILTRTRVRETGGKTILEAGETYSGDQAEDLLRRGRAVEIGKVDAETREKKVVETVEVKEDSKPKTAKKVVKKKTAKK